MATLKEIKTRIQSVKSTQKITSAMKMVASAKLRKAERSIENSLAYKDSLLNIQADLLCENPLFSSKLMENRGSSKIALLVFSSNSSLCGGFNSNIIKKLNAIVASYIIQDIKFEIIPIGKKVAMACSKLELQVESNYEKIIDKPYYTDIVKLAMMLIEAFLSKKYDRVEMLYYRYHSKAHQEIVKEQFLPYIFDKELAEEKPTADFLFEPQKDEILEALLPQILKMELFQTLLNTVCSEHATRTNAMQIATDNADDLLQELSLQFNKSRQQAITNELLDIMGGSFK